MSTPDIEALRVKYREVASRLAHAYGFPTWRQHLAPVDELVNCILSQSTSDRNRDLGYAALIEKFPTWEAVRDAPEDVVIAAIRQAGLANQKGPRIQNALRKITQDYGKITLDFLATMDTEAAGAYLQSIPGVGPKTAGIVLLFALNKPAFPVDTHVHRVSQRLGFIGPKVTADKAHAILAEIVPPDEYYPAHLNLIMHGRKVCQARTPACERCPLTDLCAYYLTSLKDARKSNTRKVERQTLSKKPKRKTLRAVPGS